MLSYLLLIETGSFFQFGYIAAAQPGCPGPLAAPLKKEKREKEKRKEKNEKKRKRKRKKERHKEREAVRMEMLHAVLKFMF